MTHNSLCPCDEGMCGDRSLHCGDDVCGCQCGLISEADARATARAYVNICARITLEDSKYRAVLTRAALVIRGRMTDEEVFRLTGQIVKLEATP